MTTIFRKNAIDHHVNRLTGTVLVTPALSYKLLTFCLVVWVALLVVWLTQSQYARKATVSGWLQPPTGISKVFARPNFTVVKDILVNEGESVREGQVLAVLKSDQYLSSGDSLEAALLSDLTAQQLLFKHQIEHNKDIAETRLKQIDKQRLAALADLEAINVQLSILQTHRSLLDKRLTRYQKIQKAGSIASETVEDLQAQRLSLDSNIQSYLRERSTQQLLIDELNSEVQLQPQQLAIKQATLKSQLSDVGQKILHIQGQYEQIIRAPRAGRISNLQADAGQGIKPHVPLMSVVPNRTEVLVKLLIPVRAAGFIQTGMPIDIRYDAFPYQKFGLYKGEVLNMSSSLLLPGEVNATPLAINEPVYLVTARLSEQYVSAYGQRLPLTPGMTLSADVSLADRTLMEWLLEPILQLRGVI